MCGSREWRGWRLCSNKWDGLLCPDLLHGRRPLGEQVGAPALGGVSYMQPPRLAVFGLGRLLCGAACHQDKAFCYALVAPSLLTLGVMGSWDLGGKCQQRFRVGARGVPVSS